MRSGKKLAVLLLLIVVALCLSSCQESNESKYGKAQELVAQGQFSEAITKFEELADFEQSGKYVSYCKAIVAGEGGDFKCAIDQLSQLGDFEKSASYKTYYETRIAEDEIPDKETGWEELLTVATTYDSLGAFLDCKEQAEACRKIVYDEAVNAATELDYNSAIAKLEALGEYKDSSTLIEHYIDERTYEYTVSALHWDRKILIEENVAYPESGWELPEDGELTDQKDEIHHYESTVDHYETTSIIRTKKEIDHYESYPTYGDKGSGIFGEIDFKRPVYATKQYVDSIAAPVFSQAPVYQTKYYYNVRRWTQTRDVEKSGDDHTAIWPETNLTEYEREGEKAEAYFFTVKENEGAPERTFAVSEDVWNGIELNGKIYFTVVKSTGTEFLSTKAGEKISDLQKIK